MYSVSALQGMIKFEILILLNSINLVYIKKYECYKDTTDFFFQSIF